MVSNSIIINGLTLIWPIISAIKEKHYVRRDSAIINGLLLVGTGLGILIESPALKILGLPLAVFPIVIGIAGIALTSSRNELGTQICSGLVTSIILGLILVVQLLMLGFSTI
mgnify:CR=1 FL=1